MLLPSDSIGRLQEAIGHGGSAIFDAAPLMLQNIINDRAWAKRLDKDGSPFESFEAFVNHRLWQGLETTVDELILYCRKRPDVQKLIKTEVGAITDQPHDEKGKFARSDNITTVRGTNPTYILRRLKRDRPDLAQKVIDGEMSANAAALEAGFRKKRRCPHCGSEL